MDGWTGEVSYETQTESDKLKEIMKIKKYVYTKYRKKLKRRGGIRKNKLKVVQNQHNVPWEVKRWTHTGNGPKRQKCNKPACGLKE